jgi:hypothetical protein
MEAIRSSVSDGDIRNSRSWGSRGPVIVAAGLDQSLNEAETSPFRLVEVASSEEVLQCFDREEVAVLVLGSRLTSIEAHDMLSRVVAGYPDHPAVNIVLGIGPEPQLFQRFIDEDRVFYLSRGPIPSAQLWSLVIAAVHCFQTNLQGKRATLAESVVSSDRLLDFCTQIASQIDLKEACGLLTQAVQSLINADRTHCLIYDPEKNVLCSMDPQISEKQDESAAAGLVGYVARTGETVHLERVGIDPRYDAEADDPGGAQDARFLAVPILGPGAGLLGVATAIRDGQSAPFAADDVLRLELLAGCAAPTLGALLFQTRIQAVLLEQARASSIADIFRKEALDYHNQNGDEEGVLLFSSPPWLKRTHWIMLVLLGFIVLYTVLGKVNENATGPVVIRARSRIDVTATAGGLVRSLAVSVGDQVRVGDLLIRFGDTLSPNTTLQRLEEPLRAPMGGIISDVRVRSGQLINPGDQVASIINEEAGYELIALLPGSYAPQIRSGMPLVLKMEGYPESHEVLPIGRVGAEILGPRQAARYVGRDSTDELPVAGSVVIVRSLLPSSKFAASERSYSYHEGMRGTAEVSVRSEPIIVNLIPGLKEFLSR